MARTKKNEPVNGEVMATLECTENRVSVDLDKLSAGLKTTFSGIAMIFESIGADTALDEIKEAADSAAVKTKPRASKKTADKQEEQDTQEQNDVEKTDTTADNDTAADNGSGNNSDEVSDGADGVEVIKPSETKKQSTSSITLDDVTKIIVQKIKKDRSNNKKVGEILKEYGVSKVNELPESKYEAFITDLAAL